MTDVKPEGTMRFDPKDVEENKAIACLSYVGILFLIPLLAKKESKFAQAHAKQGIALFILAVVVSVVSWIPLIGWLLALAVLILAIFCIVKTLQGDFFKIPVLYDLSKKFNF